MDKAMSLRVADAASKDHSCPDCAQIAKVILPAETNRWDEESLNPVHRILPGGQFPDLGDDRVRKRNHLVRSVLKRFDQVLTPPVPPDVEQHIRLKDQCNWLPWEEEVIAKVGCWRAQLEEIGPELMEELSQALWAIRNS